jgi:hypothetical protein
MTVSQLLVNFVITQRRCRTSKMSKKKLLITTYLRLLSTQELTTQHRPKAQCPLCLRDWALTSWSRLLEHSRNVSPHHPGPSPGVVFVACMDTCADPASNPDRGISCYNISGVAIAREREREREKNRCEYPCIHSLIGGLMFKNSIHSGQLIP